MAGTLEDVYTALVNRINVCMQDAWSELNNKKIINDEDDFSEDTPPPYGVNVLAPDTGFSMMNLTPRTDMGKFTFAIMGCFVRPENTRTDLFVIDKLDNLHKELIRDGGATFYSLGNLPIMTRGATLRNEGEGATKNKVFVYAEFSIQMEITRV